MNMNVTISVNTSENQIPFIPQKWPNTYAKGIGNINPSRIVTIFAILLYCTDWE